METEERRLQSERLPTLYEVLNNQTATPVDSWSFYTFLFQYPGALNYMDFWVDVMAHLRLCKDYVRGIRESMLMLENEEQQHLQQQQQQQRKSLNPPDVRCSATSSVLLDALLNEGYLDYHDNLRLSMFLKGDADSNVLSHLMESLNRPPGQAPELLASSGLSEDPHLSAMLDEYLMRQMKESHRPKITTKQLVASANAIVDRYLVSKDNIRSERLLANVPEHMRLDVITMVKGEQRYDPDVFEPLKIIAFQFLEIYCFPKFLSSVALHNLHYDMSLSTKSTGSPYSQYTTLSRVAIGFLLWGIGFWIGYSFVLLDTPRPIRLVPLPFFFLGCYYIVCGVYHLDIIYALCGVTQSLVSPHKLDEPELGLKASRQIRSVRLPIIFTILGGRNRLTRVRHPFVLNIMRKRALWCLFLVMLGTLILTGIFVGVPSTRL